MGPYTFNEFSAAIASNVVQQSDIMHRANARVYTRMFRFARSILRDLGPASAGLSLGGRAAVTCSVDEQPAGNALDEKVFPEPNLFLPRSD
jgi:hypothetical protein